jgi:hypothetical protein
MILYDLNKTCSDVALAGLLNVVKKLLDILQIVGPILCIISLIYTFIKLTVNPDNKKLLKRIKNSCLALVILFFIPIIVNAVMGLFDDSVNLSRCWNYNESIFNPTSSTYISVTDKSASSIITDPSDYNSNSTSKDTSTSKSTTSSTGKGMGTVKSISIKYNQKDSGGRCGTGKKDKCAQIATVEYEKGTVKYYMGYQNNSGLLGGSCRSHAFTCGLNATTNSYYSTLDLQKYLYSTGDNGVLKGKSRFTKVINHFGANATAYFNETSITKSISLAKEALDAGQPVIIFVSGKKCSDLANSHHALLLLGYDDNGKVVFLDSCSRYPSSKKRTLEQMGACMSDDGIAKNWMRMVIFSF